MSLNSAKCPVCKTPISETRFSEIQEKIRLEESAKLEELREQLNVKADLKIAEAVAAASKKFAADAQREVAAVAATQEKLSKELEASQLQNEALTKGHETNLRQLAAENEKSVANAVTDAAKKLQAEATDRLKAVEEQRQQLRDALKNAELRAGEASRKHSAEMAAAVAGARKELDLEKESIRKKEAEALEQVQKLQSEREKINAEHSAALIRKEQEAQAVAEQRYLKDKSKIEEAQRQLSQQLATAELNAKDRDKAHSAEVQRVREVLEKAKQEEIGKIHIKTATDNEILRKKLIEAERKLEKKTANELGKWPEIELEKALREAFPDDNVHRVAKGVSGVDIVHTVKHKGESCGKIVIDSKNHLRWLEAFAEKLSQDCLEAEAKHAILSTTVFPKDVRDLSIKDGVILAKPSQVVALVDLLRRAMIQNHILGLGLADEGRKKDRLYDLVTSDSYRQNFEMAERLLAELEQIDIDETAVHKKVWAQRGTLQRRLDKIVRGVNESVAAVVESPEAAEVLIGAQANASGSADNRQVIRTRIPL